MFRMQLQQHAIFIIKREGNSISQTIAMSGTEFKTALVLNEVFDWKEKEENPVYDTKVIIFLLYFFVLYMYSVSALAPVKHFPVLHHS